MPKRRENDKRVVDEELNGLVADALSKGVTLSEISTRGKVDRATLWRWRQGIYSPVMRHRQEVLDAIRALIQEKEAERL